MAILPVAITSTLLSIPVGTSGVVTLSHTPTNGNALVCVIIGNTGGSSVSSLVQTGVVWHLAAVTTFNPGANPQTASIYYASNVSGASANVTFNVSAAPTAWGIIIGEYSGVAALTPLDQTAFNNGNSSTGDSGTTLVTTQNDELWVGGLGVFSGSTSQFNAPSGGFTMQAQVFGDGLAGNPMAYFDNIVTAQGQANVNASVSNGSGPWGGVMATFGTGVVPPCPAVPFTTAGDYINQLRERFAEINFVTWLPDTDLISWMNLGIDDIVMRTLPPRNEKAPVLIPVTPGVYTYDIPADWFRNKQFGDSGGFYVIGPNYFNILLEEDRTDDLEEDLAAFPNSNASTPNNFWIWNKKIYIYPIPDIAYTLKLYYYRLPIQICTVTDTVDLDRPWTETLMKFVLWKSLEKDKHPMAQYYRNEYEQGLSNMYSESRVKVEKRARYVHTHGFYGVDRG